MWTFIKICLSINFSMHASFYISMSGVLCMKDPRLQIKVLLHFYPIQKEIKWKEMWRILFLTRWLTGQFAWLDAYKEASDFVCTISPYLVCCQIWFCHSVQVCLSSHYCFQLYITSCVFPFGFSCGCYTQPWQKTQPRSDLHGDICSILVCFCFIFPSHCGFSTFQCLERGDPSLEAHVEDFFDFAHQLKFPDNCLCSFLGTQHCNKHSVVQGGSSRKLHWVLVSCIQLVSSPTPNPVPS